MAAGPAEAVQFFLCAFGSAGLVKLHDSLPLRECGVFDEKNAPTLQLRGAHNMGVRLVTEPWPNGNVPYRVSGSQKFKEKVQVVIRTINIDTPGVLLSEETKEIDMKESHSFAHVDGQHSAASPNCFALPLLLIREDESDSKDSDFLTITSTVGCGVNGAILTVSGKRVTDGLLAHHVRHALGVDHHRVDIFPWCSYDFVKNSHTDEVGLVTKDGTAATAAAAVTDATTTIRNPTPRYSTVVSSAELELLAQTAADKTEDDGRGELCALYPRRIPLSCTYNKYGKVKIKQSW